MFWCVIQEVARSMQTVLVIRGMDPNAIEIELTADWAERSKQALTDYL
jgi:hypothetical protein